MAISYPKIEKFETWAIVEVMGHNKFAGYVSEQTIAGKSFVRVDVPESGAVPAFSKMFGPDSIYCITPVSELVAKSLADGLRSKPLQEFDLPSDIRAAISQVMIDRKALPAPDPAPAIRTTLDDDSWDDIEDHADHDTDLSDD